MNDYRSFFAIIAAFSITPWIGAQDDDTKQFEAKVKKQIEDRIVNKAKAEAAAMKLPSGMHVIVEWIEVEAQQASDWIFENPLLTDASGFRREVQTWLKAGDAKLVETQIISARSGQRAKAEAIHEHIYPTEFDPPLGQVPQKKNAKDKDGEGREMTTDLEMKIIPPTPTAFETRNVGSTLEVDPVLGADGTVDLNLAPELVQQAANTKHVTVAGDTEMSVELPHFQTSKFTTQVQLNPGTYALLGTSRLGQPKLENAKDPILLTFVRVDVSGE